MIRHMRQLQQLAQLYGVQTAYSDVNRRRRAASADCLLNVLRVFGVPVENMADVPDALRARRQAQWQQLCEPVVVFWEGQPGGCTVRLPERGWRDGTISCHLRLENGEKRQWSLDLDRAPVAEHAEVEGVRYIGITVTPPGPLPVGYHQLQLLWQGRSWESFVLVAPRRAYTPLQKIWGAFVPLYALHSQSSWGGGDIADLETLVEWTAQRGGHVIATLPLLTAFLDEPFDPSPYAPASRLFWNEFYLDITRIPELQRSPAAQQFLASTEVQQEITALRAAPLVDYRRQMALKRRVLALLARSLFAEPSQRLDAFRQFVVSRPAAEDYAHFRAVGEQLRAPWPQWPQPLRDGALQEGAGDEDTKHYHLYVQWLIQDQLGTVAERAKQRNVGLYLDLPLGVHAYSYDVWRERAAFAVEASGGAPPDAVFTKGQDWGFPPLHPEGIRAQRYRYVIAYIRHHLQHAKLLRIDHVMGLHRLFWVPKGCSPSEGAYVRYPAEELYAILSLESHRHSAAIVGENLGTVPSAVNKAMGRHNIQRMYVLQYELPSALQRPLRAVPAEEVASVNTHDMPPFAAFWHGLDLHDRLALGLMDEAGLRHEQHQLQAQKEVLVTLLQREGWLRQEDSDDLQMILTACLSYLAASPARVVLVNLEDLWLETRPQNVPGTGVERANWCRKTREPFAVWSTMSLVVNILERVGRLRGKSGRKHSARRKTARSSSSTDVVQPLQTSPGKRDLDSAKDAEEMSLERGERDNPAARIVEFFSPR
jgi:4-alpha-glucanotransferase